MLKILYPPVDLFIIREMKERGKTIPSERRLAKALEDAFDDGNLEYVVVKGDQNGLQYSGYQFQRFGISKGTLR
ncbi:hypothetical protein GCM10010347_63960 [Streptomyces cirratus]|uniref:Uncharacterized protein n=1 Tax=Streptomyces cirratus TaxID=68187 RepID=A0ABQ3F277_9ACTN|nr:hypothetical protein [Streptomyces cirratus]GHB84263.1 hypothetical protein GCM10010347_63960 [Streptomyces cirratus]